MVKRALLALEATEKLIQSDANFELLRTENWFICALFRRNKSKRIHDIFYDSIARD